MYNIASKLLAPLFDPFTLAILLAVAALLTWSRRRLALRFLLASILVLVIFSTSFVPNLLVRSLEEQYRDAGVDVPPAQAIVVLGGALRLPSGRHGLSALIDPTDRLLEAFRLYRSGKAPLIFCSGGNNPIGSPAGQLPEATWMARLLEEWSIPATAIQVETGSINTRENALLSYQALAPRGIRRIILVTSAMHMRRAVGAFRKVGFEVLAVPADFRTGWAEEPLLSRLLPKPDNLSFSEEALREWLGILVYRLRGWI